jgi:hypothetical protein
MVHPEKLQHTTRRPLSFADGFWAGVCLMILVVLATAAMFK